MTNIVTTMWAWETARQVVNSAALQPPERHLASQSLCCYPVKITRCRWNVHYLSQSLCLAGTEHLGS